MNKVVALLSEHRDRIVKTWYDHALDTYPPETARLWKKSADQFQNPVAFRLRQGIEAVLAAVINPDDTKAMDEVLFYLDDVLRVRAVQNFSPSGAVGFLFLLKKTIRETLWTQLVELNAWEHLLAVESFIDGLALTSLDLYSACREKLFDIKVKELEKHQHLLLKHAQLIVGIGEGEPAE